MLTRNGDSKQRLTARREKKSRGVNSGVIPNVCSPRALHMHCVCGPDRRYFFAQASISAAITSKSLVLRIKCRSQLSCSLEKGTCSFSLSCLTVFLGEHPNCDAKTAPRYKQKNGLVIFPMQKTVCYKVSTFFVCSVNSSNPTTFCSLALLPFEIFNSREPIKCSSRPFGCLKLSLYASKYTYLRDHASLPRAIYGK